MAHADDLEETAGGTFAKYIADGYRGLIVILSRCNSGWNALPGRPEYISSLEIVPQRRMEAEAAAAVLGATLYMGDLLENNYTLRDGRRIVPGFSGAAKIYSEGEELGSDEVEDGDLPHGTPICVAAGFGKFDVVHPAIERVIDLLCEWEPELVLGQMMDNFNPDHLCASQIAAMAWIHASKRCSLGPLWLPTPDYEHNPQAFPPLKEDHWVDVTGYEAVVLEALACHRCQGGSTSKTQEYVRRRWSHFGELHGVVAAEGFTKVYR